MNVPSALDEYELYYAELMIDLPPEWLVQDDDENNYWPIRWLKILARLPIDSDTWLGYGHTIALVKIMKPYRITISLKVLA